MADNLKTIKCPACQKDMVKVFVPSEGVNIDICLNGCGGIYFDNREFQYFDEQHENIDDILETIEGKTFEKVDESLPRSCPVCGARMVKNHASAKKEILVDDCYSCGGKFLDNGELQKIRAQYATEEERSADVMTMLYGTVGVELRVHEERREKAREEANKNRTYIRKIFDKLFGI